MDRRSYIATVGLGCLAGLSGCLSVLEDDEEGDDFEEYTPDKSTPATEEIGEANPLDETARQKSISAKTEAFVNPEVGFSNVRSNIESYSFDQLDVTIRPDGHIFDVLEETGRYAVQAFARRYPDGLIVGSGHSEFFVPEEVTAQETKSLNIDYRENVVGNQVSITVHFSEELISEDESELGSQILGPGELFAGTDPFTVTEQGIRRYEMEHDRDSERIKYQELTTLENHPSEGQYTVHNAEGGYFVYFETITPQGFPPIIFPIPFYVPKRTFAHWKKIDRPNHPEAPQNRTSYVTDSREEGIGQFVGGILDAIAELQGFTSDREKIEMITTFVQSLPYALDPISTGYRDYSRLPAETLVDAKGDCVDTSILLCVALLESSVDCDVAYFSFSPEAVAASDGGHLAVGIAPENVSYDDARYFESRGQRYYYLEPTGFTKIPNIPRKFDFDQAEIHHI